MPLTSTFGSASAKGFGFTSKLDIVKNGLIVDIDAGISSSFNGIGSTWIDLSGNGNHFSLFNSPSWSGTSLNFNGSNQYAKSSSTLNLSPYNSITVEVAFAPNTTTTPTGMCFEHSSDWNTQSMGFGLVPNSEGSTNYLSNSHHTNQVNGTGSFNYNGTVGTGITVHTNIWTRISDSTGRDAYINGVQRGVTVGTRVTGNYGTFRNDFMYLSSRAGSSVFYNQKIYYFRVYGRKLMAEEILQNYNVAKSRYGL